MWPIGQVWMLDILAGYLKEPTGIPIGRVRAQIQNLDSADQKGLGEGLSNPEGLREWPLRKMVW